MVRTRIRGTPTKSRDSIKKRAQAALDAGNVQEVVDNLTVRQRRFVEEYLVDFNGAAAVLRAGYSVKNRHNAARLGTEMLQHPGIRAAIDAVTEQRASESVVKPDYVTRKIVRTIEKAEDNNNLTAVLRGCELLARTLGMFVERKEISGPNGDAIKYEQVQEAADAFTRSINSIIDRGGTDDVVVPINAGNAS